MSEDNDRKVWYDLLKRISTDCTLCNGSGIMMDATMLSGKECKICIPKVNAHYNWNRCALPARHKIARPKMPNNPKLFDPLVLLKAKAFESCMPIGSTILHNACANGKSVSYATMSSMILALKEKHFRFKDVNLLVSDAPITHLDSFLLPEFDNAISKCRDNGKRLILVEATASNDVYIKRILTLYGETQYVYAC